LVADHVEVAPVVLDAGRAFPATAVGLDQLGAPFEALVVERRADRAVFLELEVAIIGVAGAHADLVEELAVDVDLAAYVEAVLRATEPWRLLPLARSERVADRYAVEAVVVRVGHADIAALADPRRAQARGPGFGRGVGQGIADRRGRGEIRIVG